MVGHYGPYCQNLLQGSALEGKGQTGAFQKPESSKAASTKNCSLEKNMQILPVLHHPGHPRSLHGI